ncbi:DUF885 domain-containing protein [Phenylobacterium montanum]|uniref:DUF885 family protein n=1 Tax=Phenylobacterium montanum TaxID=2823693 RepID=A0A975IUF9_9CAUL|nr:DUF885 family protein [Caulobacter sp. S6]QUD86206.1 DUF885 family protein [Caulobacter sp. S6]
MLDRREFLLSSAASALLPAAARAAGDADGRLNSLFDALFQAELRRNPEMATQLGLDKGANYDLKSRLRDESLGAVATHKAETLADLKQLKAIDRGALGPAARVNYDTVLYQLEARAAVQRFDFGGSSYGPSPYVISQQSGAYQSVPEFLDTKHAIVQQSDAEAYLNRISGLALELDKETDRLRHDSGEGIVPPDFILDLTLAQMQALDIPGEQSVIATSIARRAKAAGLGDAYGHNAARLFDQRVRPALQRQMTAVKTLRTKARHDAGIGHLKQGPEFYAAALKSTTTTSLSPDDIHKLGLDQATEIGARIDELLKAQGLTQGTLAQRIKGLYADPASFFPNTDEGKALAIAYCNGRLDAIRPKLPTLFKRLPPYKFEVRRVPPQTEAGAASAFSQGPALDGSRPGLVYINLRDTAEWPKWSLPSVTFHEGLPGHQLEGGLALSNTDLPMIRKASGFSGYAEGWALYAEQLADEIGMYADDPLGRIGYLRFQLFRAGRCVVDTGLHHLGWSREQAIQYFVDLEADAPGFAAREVERYCVNPGQACSYKLGHTVWTQQRAKAQAALGPRYDIKNFHEAGLGCGRVPLEVLEGVIGDWIGRTKAA